MGKIYNSVEELVGGTPLLRLGKIERSEGLSTAVYAKLECFNPGGSAKDRVALQMIRDAQLSGVLKADSVIIEPTSGNTGIGLAAIGTALGYKTVIVMPETMSEERKKLMRAYGATLVLTDGKRGMSGAIERAKELAAETPNSFIPDQFANLSNPTAHYNTTGAEIFADTDGRVDIFVACVGTGGTVSGVGKYLKERNPQVRVIAVEPAGSPVLTGGEPGPHKIQGIGAGFVPDVLDTQIYDEVITVTDGEAYAAARLAARNEGVLVGISSGAALHAALAVARRPENKGKSIVVLLPDTGERYLSAGLFD